MRIFYGDQIQRLEELYSADGNDHIKLMETAGDCVARFIHEKYNGVQGLSVAVLCGHGNNGGDGFAAARKLLDNGAKVRIILVDGEPKTDDAVDMFGRAEIAGVKYVKCPTVEPNVTESSVEEIEAVNELNDVVKRYILEADVIIDAIFGIGYHGNNMPEHIAKIIELTTMSEAPVISVDIPSGIVADTGRCAEPCIRAAYTLTFTAMKPAHVIYPSTQYCGTVLVAQIGISEKDIEAEEKMIFDIDRHAVKLAFEPRLSDTHKGDYGKLLAICGSTGMAGAAILAGRAAVHSGAGLVRMALPKEIYPIVAGQCIESVYSVFKTNGDGMLNANCCDKLGELLGGCNACLIGCGLGGSEDIKKIVKYVIKNCKVPLVLDADALTAISDDLNILREAQCPLILTPHLGEMGRLIGKETAEIKASRLECAVEFAKKYGVHLILKGANSIVADPDGKAYINFTGNPGMAKGGSGDVLAGIIGSLAAQGMSILDSCTCGVFVHGLAGDKAAERYSQHAVTPTDIIFELSTVFCEIER